MIFSNINKPSSNMLLSQRELSKMIQEQEAEIYEKDRESRLISESTYDDTIDRDEYNSNVLNCQIEQSINTNNRIKFLENAKNSFISECIYKLYCESLLLPLTSKNKTIGRNLVNSFVKENGAGNLINSFSTKNLLLSEMSRISQKYYNKILESVEANKECRECIEYNLDNTIKDDFYKELENIDTFDATKLIKERVADAVQQFIDDNSCAKLDYEDIIKQAQEKIASAKDEAVIEEYSNIAKLKINELKNKRKKNIFNLMVESLTRKILTDDEYKARYVNESKVDMDSVVDNVQLIYTMLEMVNTTCMVNVDESFISGYLKSLS